jgi:hypothetical protein
MQKRGAEAPRFHCGIEEISSPPLPGYRAGAS